MDSVATILQLHTRITAARFGSLLLPPAEPFAGPTGTILVKPVAGEKTDVQALLFRLARDYRFEYGRDQLELHYEHGAITLARLTFLAGTA